MQLTQLEGWDALRRLADEQGFTLLTHGVDEYRAVVRAYRQVAQRLRDRGYGDIADRMADRAEVRQRKLLFRQMLGDVLAFRSSLHGDRHWRPWFLALLAGYGYHPGRSVFWYLATIAGFTSCSCRQHKAGFPLACLPRHSSRRCPGMRH